MMSNLTDNNHILPDKYDWSLKSAQIMISKCKKRLISFALTCVFGSEKFQFRGENTPHNMEGYFLALAVC